MTAFADHLTTYVLGDGTETTSLAPGRWPWAGLGAGLASLASLTVLNAPYIADEAVFEAGPEAVYAELSGQLLTQLGAAAGYLSAALLVAFGIGFVRTLARRHPDDVGAVVAIALALAAGVATTVSAYAMKSVLASGLPGHGDNAFYTHVDTAVTYTIAGQLQYAGWLPVVAAAGLVGVLCRHERGLLRWYALASMFLAGAVAVVTVAFNLPWSSGLVAPLWLLATGVVVLRLRARH